MKPLTTPGSSLFHRPFRRTRMPLSDGHMDVCLSPDASPETIAALKQIGEAAIERMKREEESDGRREAD